MTASKQVNNWVSLHCKKKSSLSDKITNHARISFFEYFNIIRFTPGSLSQITDSFLRSTPKPAWAFEPTQLTSVHFLCPCKKREFPLPFGIWFPRASLCLEFSGCNWESLKPRLLFHQAIQSRFSPERPETKRVALD